MPHTTFDDPSPLTGRQLWALAASASRDLTWGLRTTAIEIRHWRRMAECIPPGTLRDDALHALDSKRGHLDGAALCSILPRRRNPGLVRALVAYQTILDFLDNVSERHPTLANGRRLHLALVDAVNPGQPPRDYYRCHPWQDDGGYLHALVLTCQESCQLLASFALVHQHVVGEARLSAVLGLNHETDPSRRDSLLRAWAATAFPNEPELSWFELTAAASASLLVHVLLSLAADESLEADAITSVRAAHWPWIALAATMLDSYADLADDLANGDHSYIEHYGDNGAAVARLQQAIEEGMRRARSLPNGYRHAVVVGSMTALYLSKPSARAVEMRGATRTLERSGGSLVRLLLPILRTWRAANAQPS